MISELIPEIKKLMSNDDIIIEYDLDKNDQERREKQQKIRRPTFQKLNKLNHREEVPQYEELNEVEIEIIKKVSVQELQEKTCMKYEDLVEKEGEQVYDSDGMDILDEQIYDTEEEEEELQQQLEDEEDPDKNYQADGEEEKMQKDPTSSKRMLGFDDDEPKAVQKPKVEVQKKKKQPEPAKQGYDADDKKKRDASIFDNVKLIPKIEKLAEKIKKTNENLQFLETGATGFNNVFQDQQVYDDDDEEYTDSEASEDDQAQVQDESYGDDDNDNNDDIQQTVEEEDEEIEEEKYENKEQILNVNAQQSQIQGKQSLIKEENNNTQNAQVFQEEDEEEVQENTQEQVIQPVKPLLKSSGIIQQQQIEPVKSQIKEDGQVFDENEEENEQIQSQIKPGLKQVQQQVNDDDDENTLEQVKSKIKDEGKTTQKGKKKKNNTKTQNFLKNKIKKTKKKEELPPLVIKLYEWTKQTIDIQAELTIDLKSDFVKQKRAFRKEIAKEMPLTQRIRKSIASLILVDQKRYGEIDVNKKMQTYLFKEDLFFYVASCNCQKLSKAFQDDPENIKIMNDLEYTLLYFACRQGFDMIVQYLVEKGADINQQVYRQSTALHAAAFYGHKRIVEFLLINGAKTDLTNDKGKTAYDEAYKSTKPIFEYYFKHRDNPVLDFITQNIHQKYFQLATKMYIQNEKGEQECNGFFCQINYDKNKEEKEKVQKIYQNMKKYKRAFHGTKLKYTQGIIETGLKTPSERGSTKLDSGRIPLDIKFRNVTNWADAVFVSQSVYMASQQIYSEKLLIQNEKDEEEQYSYLLQVQVRKKKFDEFKQTLGKKYLKKEDEPDGLEWRVKNSQHVALTGIYFSNDIVLHKIQSHTKARQQKNEQASTSFWSEIFRSDKKIHQCLKGHKLQKPIQQTGKCDICGQNVYNFLHCEDCRFSRCTFCMKQERYLP